MKRYLLTLLFALSIATSAWALSYEEARRQAWFLTDKMAYELNLTPSQYDRAYEVNLEYFLNIDSPSDCNGRYWRYRNMDFSYILFDWQYNLFSTLDYFFRPIRWVRAAWYYPVCDHYRYGYYYFDRPTCYHSYHGGHWRRRSHNDISPYRHIRFDRGHGMRDRYNNGVAHRPGTNGRPGGQRPEPGFRPDRGHDKDNGRFENYRPNRPNRPGNYRPNRYENNSSRPNRSSNRP